MYLCKNLIYPSSHKITFARRYVKTNLNILSEISMYAVLRGRWKKYNICFDDQITDHWIKNDIAPPMCVFPRGGRQSPALKTIENNSKQWPLSETLHSKFCKTFHYDHHDNQRNDANDHHQKGNDHQKIKCLIGKWELPKFTDDCVCFSVLFVLAYVCLYFGVL